MNRSSGGHRAGNASGACRVGTARVSVRGLLGASSGGGAVDRHRCVGSRDHAGLRARRAVVARPDDGAYRGIGLACAAPSGPHRQWPRRPVAAPTPTPSPGPKGKKYLEAVRKKIDTLYREAASPPTRTTSRRSRPSKQSARSRTGPADRRGPGADGPAEGARRRRGPRPVPQRRAAARGPADAQRRPAAVPGRRGPAPPGRTGHQGPARRNDAHPGRLGAVRARRGSPVEEAGGQPRGEGQGQEEDQGADRRRGEARVAAGEGGEGAPGAAGASRPRTRRSRPGWAPASSTRSTARRRPEGKKAVEYATAQIGKPYEWGAEGPDVRLLGPDLTGVGGRRTGHPAHLAGAVASSSPRRRRRTCAPAT